MTEIILIHCEFAYHVEFGFICDYTKMYYAMLLVANCVSKVGHLRLALVAGSKTKSTDIFN